MLTTRYSTHGPQRRTGDAGAAPAAAGHAIAGRRDHRPVDHRDRDRRVLARRAAAGRARPRRVAGSGPHDGAGRAGAAPRAGPDRNPARARRRVVCARPVAGVVHRCGGPHAAGAARRTTGPLRRDLSAAGHRVPGRRGVPLRTRHFRAAGEIRGVPNRRRAAWRPSKPTAGFIWRSWTPPTTTSSSRCCSTSRRR